MEIHPTVEDPFRPESYRGKTVDIVHETSLSRIIEGKKPADQSTIGDARRILLRISQLRDPELQVTLRAIEDPSVFTPPTTSDLPPILGGAFDGQCLKDYQLAAKSTGIVLKPDPHLTLRLD
jgi:hypothetical protein